MSERPGESSTDASGSRRPAGGARGSRSQTLERALDALGILADGKPRASGELAAELGLHRSIVYRFLRTLEDYHFVSRAQDGRYILGLGIAALAESGLSGSELRVEDILDELANATQATAILCVAQKDHAVVLFSARPSSQTAAVSIRRSTRFPLSSGAPGMAILALDPLSEDDSDEVKLARKIGYVHTKGGPFPGFDAVARPVRMGDSQGGSLAVVYPTSEHRSREVAQPLQHAALRIERPAEVWSN